MNESEPPTPEREPERDRPRIYVASLADYNAGRLHGAWIAPDMEPDDLDNQIGAMLASSREPVAEEWAIHDHEGFGPLHLSEYESVESLSAIGRGIAEHDEAFAAWASLESAFDIDRLQRFDEACRGTWQTLDDYADDLLEDLGAQEALETIPDWLQPYVHLDAGAFARDLELGGEIATVEGRDGLHIFDCGL